MIFTASGAWRRICTAPQITPRDENRFSVSPAFNRLLIKKGSLDLNVQQDHGRRVDAVGEYR